MVYSGIRRWRRGSSSLQRSMRRHSAWARPEIGRMSGFHVTRQGSCMRDRRGSCEELRVQIPAGRGRLHTVGSDSVYVPIRKREPHNFAHACVVAPRPARGDWAYARGPRTRKWSCAVAGGARSTWMLWGIPGSNPGGILPRYSAVLGIDSDSA